MTRSLTVEATILRILAASDMRRTLSLRRAVPAIRAELPSCEIDDREMADLVARHAVACGFNSIAFDLPQEP